MELIGRCTRLCGSPESPLSIVHQLTCHLELSEDDQLRAAIMSMTYDPPSNPIPPLLLPTYCRDAEAS